jgi:hypothetical protein
MDTPHIRTNPPPFSASAALEGIADSLSAIKHSSGLSDARLADPLFKSPDRLRDYREGHSEMGAIAFIRACAAWGPAFADAPLGLAGYRLVPTDAAGTSCDVSKVSTLAQTLAAIAQQTTPDSPGGASITDDELLKLVPALEAASLVIDELRQRAARVRQARRAGA